MHELSVALGILEVAGEVAERHAGRVAVVHLKFGPLAGVVKEALLSAFELAREGTPLAQAELRIEEVPLVAWCSACAAPHALPSAWELCCPRCGAPTPEIVSGKELEVVALEIES